MSQVDAPRTRAQEQTLQVAHGYKASCIYNGSLFSKTSEEKLRNLVNQLCFNRRPEVSLTGEGTYRLIWRDGSGTALCIHLPGDGALEYAVWGPGKKFGLPDILERGTCAIEEVYEVIEAFRLDHLLGYGCP